MLSARNPRLEGDLFFARLRRRDLTWAEAHTVVWNGSYFMNDDGDFKLLMQACERLECLHGYVIRFNATYIYCEFLECDPVVDRDTCCEPAMPCTNITTCEGATIPDPFGYCLATTCDEDRDRPHCCISSAYCRDLPRCVIGYTHLPGGEDNRCPRLACDAVLDRDTCCTPAAPCTNMSSYSCPHSFYFNYSWWCEGVVCDLERDQMVCCMPAESCGNTTVEVCTHGLLLKPNATEHYCDGFLCDADRDKPFCCDPADPCSSMNCSHGFTTMPDTFCDHVICDPVLDSEACCVPKAPCTDLVGRDCPFGHFFNTTDFCANISCVEQRDRPLCCQVASPCTNLECPVSYQRKPGASALFCEGLHCDLQRDLLICCDVAEPCSNMTCPQSYTLRPNATTRYCLGPECVEARDLHVCCEDAGDCFYEYLCPHGFTPRNNTCTEEDGPFCRNGTFCEGPSCVVELDRDNCCEPAMPCTNITCPWNYIHTPDRYCPATTCTYSRDVFHCCERGVPLQFVRFSALKLREITADDNFRQVIQLAEMTIYFHNRRTALETAAAYSLPGNAPINERPEKVIDDILGTKWLDFDSSPIIVEFPEPEKMDAFTLTTANDLPSRDPVSWIVEGSADGGDFVLLHELTDGYDQVPLVRFAETRQFPIAVPCLPPRPDAIANGLPQPCLEGTLIGSGSICTPVCKPGFEPSLPSLNCTEGELLPPTFECF